MPKSEANTESFDTETRILRAAETEFMEKGFSGARTTSIAEAAGVNHAMLHYYFRTKEKLFDRIISEKTAMLKDALIHSIANRNLSLFEMIEKIIAEHLDFIAANPKLPRFIISELHTDSERSARIREKISFHAPAVLAGIQSQIDKAAAAGLCRNIDAKTLMLDIVSLNVFPYLATPLINAILDNIMADSETFLEKRKKENYNTIMRKLRP